MASGSSSAVVNMSPNTTQNLITINAAAQLPLKLIKVNYFSWRAQFNALFFGLDLLGYLDGSLPCPVENVTHDGKIVPNPNYLPCASEVLWIKNLLQELHVTCPTAPKIFCDNVGVTYLSVNPVFQSRMKHIAIDYHFVRDHVARGSFSVSHISSKEQLADALTKPLSSASFQTLRSKIGISNGSSILRGDVREISTEPCSESSPDYLSNCYNK